MTNLQSKVDLLAAARRMSQWTMTSIRQGPLGLPPPPKLTTMYYMSGAICLFDQPATLHPSSELHSHISPSCCLALLPTCLLVFPSLLPTVILHFTGLETQRIRVSYRRPRLLPRIPLCYILAGSNRVSCDDKCLHPP